MAIDAPLSKSTALVPVGDFELDRSKAFRRARRHTLLVRTLRIAFPLATVLLFASYGLFVGRSYEFSIGDGRMTVGPVSLSHQSVTAENPYYEGFNKDGGKFIVKAKSAEHDLRRTGPIALKTIDGTLAEPDGTVTRLRAPRGSFDTRANVLELLERIDVTANSGLKAVLTSATAFMNENKIVSGEPVTVEMPGGVVRGNELVLFAKTRQAAFSKGVAARFKPEPPSARAGKAASSARVIGAGDAPIDVTSLALDVDDVKRAAVFKGNVRATQGEAILTAAELEVGYEGRSVPEAPDAGGSGAGRLNRIVASTDVVITQGEDRVTSRTAAFDPKSDTALLTGDVVVTQAKNVLKGRRLFVDRQAATSQLTSPAGDGEPKGRISARLYQNPNEAAGAPQKGGAKAQTASQGDAPPIPLRTDPNAPIDIEADQLDVDDRGKTAVFRGNVIAEHGDYTIRTAELAASYTGESGIALGSERPEGGVRQAAALKKVQARKTVLITSKDGESGSGERGDFDIKANTVTLIGNVVLMQGGNTATGPKAVIDLSTGKSQIVPDAITATAQDQGTEPAAPRASGTGASRPSLLFYPSQVKDKDKAKQKGSSGETKRENKDATGAAKERAGGDATRASSWSADTRSGFGAND